mmetsp:Transcript_26137/g.49072  ORF Transcript_26137/g.49072 Transcript_26137/m.49072 type:complete len:293 (-) Transcript_26137:41-919(-)
MHPSSTTWPWWGSMVIISFCNFLFFRHVRMNVRSPRTAQDRRYQVYLRNLCAPFLFECAWRSVFPSLYNERQVLFDTPLNSILIDRSLAALGEVCWVLQICLVLEQLAADLKHPRSPCCGQRFVEMSSPMMALLAVTGEVFSFLGTFTTNARYEVFEAICWCSLFAIAALTAASLLVRASNAGALATASRRFLAVLSLQGLLYCPYMICFNIPMYESIWRRDEEHGKTYFDLWEGMLDSWRTRNRCQNWSCWRHDWFWMSFYFSVAVWSSICMMYAPRLSVRQTAQQVAPRV